MDLLKKKLGRGKKGKDRTKTKKASKASKKISKKEKKREKKRKSREYSSSSSSESQKNVALVKSTSKYAIEALDRKYKMAGNVTFKPQNPVDYPLKVLKSEYMEMFYNGHQITVEDCKILDEYLRKKAELRSSDHVVIAETINDDEKKTTRLKIMTKYDEGRFGAIYIVQSESAVDDNVVSVTNSLMAMKTALRHVSSNAVVARLNREIRVLSNLASKQDEAAKRILPLYFEGRILGFPFFVTQLMDINLEKCREEMGGLFALPSAYHIAQEILMALKWIHRRNYIHRDVKPTNVSLSNTIRTQFILIDFGEAIPQGKGVSLSPPDGLTLPFLSREGHEILNQRAPSTFIQDIESWFYVFIDLIRPLPWKERNNVDQVQKMKKHFWDNLETSLPTPDYPSHAGHIAKFIKSQKLEPPYNEISKMLQDGFIVAKEAEPSWKPDWLDRQLTAQLNKEKRERQRDNSDATLNERPERTAVVTGSNERTTSTAHTIAVDDFPAAVKSARAPKEQAPKRDGSMYGQLDHTAKPAKNCVAQVIGSPRPDFTTTNTKPADTRQDRSVYLDFGLTKQQLGTPPAAKVKYRPRPKR